MAIELKLLVWSILLGLAYIVTAVTFSLWQRGLLWNVGNRSDESRPLSAMAARADRASRNFLETFAFFAAAVLAVVFAQRSSAATVLGAQIYFWARLAYLPVYVAGIPYLRTAIWAASIWGLLQLLFALL
jgi:uncharacterized MAPEG superfamily protein